MNSLGQFFTEQFISNLLVNKINVDNPERILDLGIGDGSLTIAAFQKWQQAQFYAVDIDPERIINSSFPPSIHLSYTNGLDYYVGDKLDLRLGSIDVAICNPPYLKLFFDVQYQKLLLESGFCNSIPVLTTDIIFLAQNLRFLKNGGTLGIILPDGLLTSHIYQNFRKDLLTNHTIESIVQLPDKIFTKTEARTHIVILKKGRNKVVNPTHLYKTDLEGNYISSLKINSEELIYRMDYEYHSWRPNNKYTNTLTSAKAIINRGSLSRKELLEQNIKHFHTTDFKNYDKEINIVNHCDIDSKILVAEKNDILLARVGTRCIGKFCIIQSGSIPISDCIYRIRLPEHLIFDFWEVLNSKDGRAWFKAHAHGVCSQVISKKDLLNFSF